MLLGAAHWLADQRKVVQLDELAEDEVHLALVQSTTDVRRIPEIIPVQVTLQILDLLKVDANVGRYLAEARLRLVHLQHLERDRIIVRAHRSDAALKDDARFKGQIRRIAGRTVFAALKLERALVRVHATATSASSSSPILIIVVVKMKVKVIVCRIVLLLLPMLLLMTIVAETDAWMLCVVMVLSTHCWGTTAAQYGFRVWNWNGGASWKSVLFLWLN